MGNRLAIHVALSGHFFPDLYAVPATSPCSIPFNWVHIARESRLEPVTFGFISAFPIYAPWEAICTALD